MIYHITTHALWEDGLRMRVYRHPTLKSEGFIHCSTLAQLPQTLERHFANETEVVILSLVENRIPKGLIKYEESTNGELYPHIYCTIPIHAVEVPEIWMKSPEGVWEKC